MKRQDQCQSVRKRDGSRRASRCTNAATVVVKSTEARYCDDCAARMGWGEGDVRHLGRLCVQSVSR